MSNGSEHLPEHTDYQKLIAEAREYVDALVGGENSNWVHLVQHSNFLADAVEALVAENERLRGFHAGGCIQTVQAARDLLDSMTEEWGVEWRDPETGVAMYADWGRDESDARAKARQRRSLNGVPIRRIVGYWVEVPESEGKA